ncbi:MFS transporter [Curvibacter sp. HBC61]|uniref:MFS transporter n=1 Tax=Curvibacter cyanobacteriorum TaxID=3026422 RepID=A0ABT5MUJ2_9BURK|nr:MFS transporter [Curvibacter sp. HBC61]MDD0837724.1 MFS transporter [Curvibacter sp. HBC61]
MPSPKPPHHPPASASPGQRPDAALSAGPSEAPSEAAAEPAPPGPSAPQGTGWLWATLLALCLGFIISQAFRTVAAMMAAPLQQTLGLSASQLGLFAATFHLAFGGLQIFMGVGIDLYGIRRTLLCAWPLTVAGALLSASATGYASLLLGQTLVGAGCAPAFLACTVFIARQFPAARFAALSGLIMGLGGLGLLLTGTPLAWLIELSSWRVGFGVLAAGSALAWLAVWIWVREAPQTGPRPEDSVLQALRSMGPLLRLPHTAGILALAAVNYAAFITLRGLWLGPLLMDRHGFTLVQSGHVALAVSVIGLLGPPLFGRLPVQGAQRRRWILRFTLGLSALFAVCGLSPLASLTVLASLVIGFLCGFIVLQYADVRAAYAPEQTGRAMALYTMAMFLGIALMQWVTGWSATWAQAHGWEVYQAVNLTVLLMLLIGALLFRMLPAPDAARH